MKYKGRDYSLRFAAQAKKGKEDEGEEDLGKLFWRHHCLKRTTNTTFNNKLKLRGKKLIAMTEQRKAKEMNKLINKATVNV